LEQLSIFNVEGCLGEDFAAALSSLWFGRGFKSLRKPVLPQKTEANLFVVLVVAAFTFLI